MLEPRLPSPPTFRCYGQDPWARWSAESGFPPQPHQIRRLQLPRRRNSRRRHQHRHEGPVFAASRPDLVAEISVETLRARPERDLPVSPSNLTPSRGRRRAPGLSACWSNPCRCTRRDRLRSCRRARPLGDVKVPASPRLWCFPRRICGRRHVLKLSRSVAVGQPVRDVVAGSGPERCEHANRRRQRASQRGELPGHLPTRSSLSGAGPGRVETTGPEEHRYFCCC
jgi:hypothetical protein